VIGSIIQYTSLLSRFDVTNSKLFLFFSQFLETLALSQWIEEVQLDYTVYLKDDTDPDSLKQIHLYIVR